MEDTFKNLDEVDILHYQMGFYPIAGAMCEALKIPFFINRSLGSNDLDYGCIVKALIMSILDERNTLCFHEKLDFCVLFGEEFHPYHCAQDVLGKTLEVLASLDLRVLSSSLSTENRILYGAPLQIAHTVNTNFYLYENLTYHEIYYGHVHSDTPLEKVIEKGQIGSSVMQDGLPLFAQILDEEINKREWSLEALDTVEELSSTSQGDLPLIIFDIAAYSEELMKKAKEQNIPVLIRLPGPLSFSRDCIRKAWLEKDWRLSDVPTTKGKSSSFYHYCSFYHSFHGDDWLLLVVYSPLLENKRRTTGEKKIEKERKRLIKKANALQCKLFSSVKKARIAKEDYLKSRSNLGNSIDCQVKVKEVEEDAMNSSRLFTGAEKESRSHFSLDITIGKINEEKFEAWVKEGSCYVLAFSRTDSAMTPLGLFKEYKNQIKAQRQFRYILAPYELRYICKNDTVRAQGLMVVLWLAALTSSYLCYRLNQSLNRAKRIIEKREREGLSSKARVDVSPMQWESFPVESLYYETLNRAAPSDHPIQVGGRVVEQPTINTMKRFFYQGKTTHLWFRDGEKKMLHRNMNKRLTALIYLGFHPLIYLKPYSTELDIWPYTTSNE